MQATFYRVTPVKNPRPHLRCEHEGCNMAAMWWVQPMAAFIADMLDTRTLPMPPAAGTLVSHHAGPSHLYCDRHLPAEHAETQQAAEMAAAGLY